MLKAKEKRIFHNGSTETQARKKNRIQELKFGNVVVKGFTEKEPGHHKNSETMTHCCIRKEPLRSRDKDPIIRRFNATRIYRKIISELINTRVQYDQRVKNGLVRYLKINIK